MPTSGTAGAAGVAVVVTDSGIAISPPEALPGPVTFVFRNEGSIAYELTAEGPGVDFASPGLQPGSATAITLQLVEGRYHITAQSEEGPRRKWCVPLQVSP